MALVPIFLHRFLEFKKVDSESFKTKWQQWKRLYPLSTFKTTDIKLHPSVVSKAEDFKKISGNIIQIPFKNAWKKEKYLKFGGLFTLGYLGVEYVLRIFTDKDLDKAVIQVICYTSKENVGIAVANSIALLLQST